MIIKKLPKLSDAQIKAYKSQTSVKRNRESRGGYVGILSATDADLD